MRTVTGSDIASLLNPRLALLVTCCDSQGQPNVLTVAWHTPLSHHPPLLGISIASTRHSHQLIQDTGFFALNIIPQSMLEAAEICGHLTGELDDKFAIAGLDTHLAKRISVPVLDDALAVLECCLENQVQAGDHTFFIGRVLHAQVCPEKFSHGWNPSQTDGLLLCLHRDRYAAFFEDL